MSADEQAEGEGPEPMPVGSVRPDLALSIPSGERFLQMRTEARQTGTLKNLQKLVAAWQAIGEKCNLAFEEMTRLAVYRLEVERDLGAYLAQTVQKGGDPPKYARRTLLPDDITRNQSSAYQKLAAVPEDVFRAYLEHAHHRGVVPSSQGARAFRMPGHRAAPTRATKKKRRARAAVAIPAAVTECIATIMTPDIVVGDANLRAGKRVAPDSKAVLEQLKGEVFVAQCTDPARWLPAIEQHRRAARITRAIVVLPAEPCAAWFATLEHGDWLVCFVRNVGDGNGVMLAHIGERPSAFRLACRELGVVVRPATAD
jgi:hypothetical protein